MAGTAKPEERGLIVAPTAQDANTMAALLREHGMEAEIAESLEDLIGMLAAGAGLLLLTEEALNLPGAEGLLEALRRQPPWSELPLIILTLGGGSVSQKLLDAEIAAGSMVLLERPMSVATLVRSAEVALRSRRRQYQVRDLLAERERALVAQARLAAIVESSDDAIVSKTLDGIIQTWNHGAERILGHKAEDVIGKSIIMIIPKDRWHEEDTTLMKLRRGERIANFETVRVAKDGRVLDASLTISPLRDESGKIIGASKILRDVTEQKRSQAALRESEERFRTLAENIPQLAWISDEKGKAVWLNERWAELTGEPVEETLKASWHKLAHPDHAKRVEQSIHKATKTGRPWEETYMLRNKEGVYRWFLARAHPIPNTTEKATRWLGTATDITEHKNFEAELERLVAERTADLSATNEQLETFVYTAAHDLRSPLRSMAGYSQLLRDDYGANLPPPAQHLLSRIQMSSEFMDKLLLDLLAYGRAARAEIELTPVAVQEAWEAALFQCGPQIEQSHAEIEAIEPLPWVLAHEATLGQVLTNLLSNALKFVEPGKAPRVRFSAEKHGEIVRLWIQDNGIGIPPDHQERVFRVFERLNGAQFPGTGIGLSIVRKGVERMGGAVGLESKEGHGTRVWIDLKKAPQGRKAEPPTAKVDTLRR